MMKTKKINLFWTGGWDSTFRLLQLLIVEKKQVQPIYIFDTGRKSLGKELDAMQAIKQQIKCSFPDVFENLSETVFIHKHDVTIPREIKGYYNQFVDRFHIGSQYLWLGAFSKTSNLEKIEISIEKANYDCLWLNYLLPFFISDGNGSYKLENSTEDDMRNLFSSFKFPLLDFSKLDMEKYAIEHKFHDILVLTWFCHNPIFDKPCGICKPCKLAIESKHNIVDEMVPPIIRMVYGILRYFKAKSLLLSR